MEAAAQGRRPIRFNAQLWCQATDWPSFRDAAIAAEAAGWHSVSTWDHLYSIFGPHDQPILEGWTAIAALAASTSRIRVGLLVGANTFRNPGLVAKLATTVDHISGGRSTLGLGGAWFEREHDAFGIDFGASVGERLERLDEAVGLVRRLLDGEIVTHEGRYYRMHDAVCEPRPIQARLPILIGGNGRTKTLRTVARHADAWNTNGSIADVRGHLAALDAHCEAVGRDRSEIELTCSFPILLRDDPLEAQRTWATILGHNSSPGAGAGPQLIGSPEAAAEAMRPYVELGFRTFVVRIPAPYDRETIARMPEVAELLS